jgi:hypothetical protein
LKRGHIAAVLLATATVGVPAWPAAAQAPAPAPPAPGGPAPGGPVPSVYIQQAVLSTVAPDPARRRQPAPACTITALMRQYCGTATSCDIGSRPVAGQPTFFVRRQADIAQICDLRLSQITDVRVTWRCRYGDRVDGTVIEESRSIALEDTGDPLGRAAFRILMACH